MTTIKLSRSEKLSHTAIRLILTAFLSIVDPGEGTISFQVLITGAIMFSYVFVYYLQNLYIIPKYFNRKKLLFF